MAKFQLGPTFPSSTVARTIMSTSFVTAVLFASECSCSFGSVGSCSSCSFAAVLLHVVYSVTSVCTLLLQVHINVLVMEARVQAELIYALRAIMTYMKEPEFQ